MTPQKVEENVTPHFGITRLKSDLHYDPASTPISIHFDQVTPANVLQSFPEASTIRENNLFRDVEAFIGRHFGSQDVVKETNYCDKITLNGATYTKLAYHFASSYEKQVCFAMVHTWWWVLDDLIYTCALKSTMGKMEIIDTIEKFIETGGNQEETLQACSDPLLRSILASHAEFDAKLGGIVSDYSKVKHRFTKGLRLYLQSNAWALMDSNLAGYSFDSFLHWRNISCGATGSNELLMLLENGNPPKYMLDHVIVKTLLDTTTTLFAIRNDIVGVRRDLARNDTGGTVMYKIRVEGKSPDVAVQEMLSLHDKVTRDYIQLRKTVLTMFKNSGQDDFYKLRNYIELLERYGYAVTFFYFTTPRYVLDGKFELEQIK